MSIEQAFSDSWRAATPIQRKRLVDAIRELRGWRGSHRRSYGRFLNWLDPEHPAALPAYALEPAVHAFESAAFLDPLYAAELKMRRARDRKPAKAKGREKARGAA